MKDELKSQPLWYERIVQGGYCIGCGACASQDNGLEMIKTPYGLYEPKIQAEVHDETGDICPFYTSKNEDHIAKQLFPSSSRQDNRVGRYENIYIGHASDEDIRINSSSGGLVTWLLLNLFKEDLIDAVIHVGATEQPDALFNFKVSRSEAEIKGAAKSRYYPVEFSQAVRIMKEKPGRYAFVGVPCYVKAIRLLAENAEAIRDSLEYCISIFCGHMKSSAFTEYFALQQDIDPKSLLEVDFRVKLQDRPANQYAIKIDSKLGDQRSSRTTPMRELHGHDWGLGLFKPKACDFCDDIAGETADISCGDAWLKEYLHDPGGNSVIIVRNKKLDNLLKAARANRGLVLKDASPEDIYTSQAGNYRHRWEGLSVRLSEADVRGEWRPQKRIQAGQFKIDRNRTKIYKLRSVIASKSHILFLQAKRNYSIKWFQRNIFRYEIAYYWLQPFRSFAKFLITRILKKIPRKK